MSQMTSLL